MGNIEKSELIYGKFGKELEDNENFDKKILEEVIRNDAETREYWTKIERDKELISDSCKTGSAKKFDAKNCIFPEAVISTKSLEEAEAKVKTSAVAKNEEYKSPFSEEEVEAAQKEIKAFNGNIATGKERWDNRITGTKKYWDDENKMKKRKERQKDLM